MTSPHSAPLRQLEVILKHEPMTEEPEEGDWVYVADCTEPDNPLERKWDSGNKVQMEMLKAWLAAGLCYATAEGAIERAWAMRRTGRT